MFSSFSRRKSKLLGKGGGGAGSSSSNIKGGAGGTAGASSRPSSSQHHHRLSVPSATSSTIPDDNDGGSIHGIRSLIGGSGVSLDGQSLTIPPSSVVLPYSSTDDNDGYAYGRRDGRSNTNPGSPSMDNSIDMYSYTLSAPGAHGEDDDIDGEATDDEDVGNYRRSRRTPGYEEDGSASAAMIMMGMSTHSNNLGDFLGGGGAAGGAANAPTNNLDGLGNQSDLAASSSASALFDGRSLQISSNEDDDMSSINSSSIYQGQQQQQRSVGGGGNNTSSLSSPPIGGAGYTPSPTTSNKYLGPYGSKLKIIGSINLVDDNEDMSLPAAASREASKRIVQGPVPTEPNLVAGVAGDNDGEDLAPDKPKALWCCGCAPLWIKRAPRWLQVVLLVSAVLALLAIVLVAVSVSFAFQARSSASSSSSPSSPGSDGSSNDPGSDFVPPPLLNDTATAAPNPNVNGDDSVSDDLNGTLTNITNPTTNSTNASTSAIDWSALLRTSFGVTAGRYPDELAAIVPELLPNFTSTRTINSATIPGQTNGEMADVESWPQFLVHLGDWNSPAYTNCGESAYEGIADMFSTSTIPVYFVPGDNEYNDCNGKEELALSRWRSTLVDYESSRWTLPYDTQVRQTDELEENFAFVYRQVIFVGLNLVSGNVYDQDVWDSRLAMDLEWVERAYDAYHNVTRAMVLFSHSSPDNSLNAAFFDPLLLNISSAWTDLEFVVMHRNNPGQVMEHTLEYAGISNLQVVSVLGSVWPPLRATVMIDTTIPATSTDPKAVTVQVEQDTLYQETPQE